MRIKFILGALLLAAVAGAYYQLFYPPSVLKRATRQALEEFSGVVATKDRAKISQALETFLTDDARIKLEVAFVIITQPDAPAVTQDFDRQGFIQFIDNVLYPLTDYAYLPTLDTFALAEDRGSAAVTFSSRDWADGISYYGGLGVGMRFSSNATCVGQIVFAEKKPRLKNADCKVRLSMAPKPGEAAKLQKALKP